MPALMEEIKPAVLMKHEFEHREKLKLKVFLRSFWTITILTQGRKTMNFYKNVLLHVLSFWLRSWWTKLKMSWLRNKSLNIDRNEKTIFLENLDFHESATGIETKDFSFEPSPENGRFWMETLARETIPVVTENYELDFRNKSIGLKNIWLSWLSGWWWKEKKWYFSNKTVHHEWKASEQEVD